MCIQAYDAPEGVTTSYMKKRSWALCLSICLLTLHLSAALAATLGPAETIGDLRAMLEEAAYGDVLLVSGDVSMDSGSPLSSREAVHISSQSGEDAVLRGLRLRNASVTFSDIALDDSLYISGTSSVHLSRGVRVRGSDGQCGLSFSGNGVLILEPGSKVAGGSGSSGVSIEHAGGDLYVSIEGSVLGGSGSTGGAGVVISPLCEQSAVFISGDIQGGRGDTLGGHALNLYSLSGNAFVTINGVLQGGDGSIGGDGIQLVSASDFVTVGVNAHVKGGSGSSHGGNAFILMNAADASSFHLSGTFSGGDAAASSAQPGTSLHLVGESAAARTKIDNCMLEDGKQAASASPAAITAIPTASPSPTPLPTPEPVFKPEVTPLPEITAPADDVGVIITPEPPEGEIELPDFLKN